MAANPFSLLLWVSVTKENMCSGTKDLLKNRIIRGLHSRAPLISIFSSKGGWRRVLIKNGVIG